MVPDIEADLDRKRLKADLDPIEWVIVLFFAVLAFYLWLRFNE